jgi:SET domain-containing protein
VLLVKTYVAPSKMHGLGCFAAENIKKGRKIWTEHPEMDVSIPFANVKKYPGTIRDFLKIYAYLQERKGKKVYILSADNARYMNHSSKPNVLEAPDGSGDDLAGRDIRKGEEMTCNYWDFDVEDAKKKKHYLK